MMKVYYQTMKENIILTVRPSLLIHGMIIFFITSFDFVAVLG